MKLVFPGGEHPQVLLGQGVNRVGSDPQSRLNQCHDTVVSPRHLGWIEQAVRRLNPKVMSHVNDVQDQGCVDGLIANDEVEKTERRRMGQQWSWPDQKH